eukprot:3079957-Pyramimonas_sp.AAC.1
MVTLQDVVFIGFFLGCDPTVPGALDGCDLTRPAVISGDQLRSEPIAHRGVRDEKKGISRNIQNMH